jgi:hypothetical protein
MDESIGAAIILMIIFGFILAVIYLGIRRKERLALLEKGVDSSYFLSKETSFTTIKSGLFLVGIAVGILLGNILDAYTLLQEEVAYFSMIFLFGGISLIIGYFLEKKGIQK